MLYPEITPQEIDFLKRDDHDIYYEISGNMQGVPIVFLHGGPGSGTADWQRQFFDSKKFKIILLDQRGCGKSKPQGSLKNNTTQHLVEDLHALKQHLNVEKWHIFGGSWGSTLALAYADAYPEDFLSINIYGIFLCRERELFDLYFEGGVASQVFADKYEIFSGLLTEKQKENPIKSYFNIFNGQNKNLKSEALKAWKFWEVSISRLEIDNKTVQSMLGSDDVISAFSLIENHYFMHNGFINGDDLLKGIGAKVKNIPVNIIQGRYDMVCPFKTAYELHKAIPNSQLHVIGNAGHTAKEPQTLEKIINILNTL